MSRWPARTWTSWIGFARYYDPLTRQFTQPDTIIPDLSNSQDWNRYSYVRNNPITYNDPTGHDPCLGGGGGCGGVRGEEVQIRVGRHVVTIYSDLNGDGTTPTLPGFCVECRGTGYLSPIEWRSESIWYPTIGSLDGARSWSGYVPPVAEVGNHGGGGGFWSWNSPLKALDVAGSCLFDIGTCGDNVSVMLAGPLVTASGATLTVTGLGLCGLGSVGIVTSPASCAAGGMLAAGGVVTTLGGAKATYEIWQNRDDAIQPLRAPWRNNE